MVGDEKPRFLHIHPYEIFIPDGCRNLIVGTLPPPRLSTKEFRKGDVDFCYGSCDNLLWPCLAEIFNLSLFYTPSPEAVSQRKEFLITIKTGICDIVASCYRKEMNASDLGMFGVRLRDIFSQLEKHPSIDTLLFTGGDSKNGPEYFFRKQAKEYDVQLSYVEKSLPRRHGFHFNGKKYQSISLISPSQAANRAVGSTLLYKQNKKQCNSYSTFDYRVDQYRKVFQSLGIDPALSLYRKNDQLLLEK